MSHNEINRNDENLWLKITAEDYEGHMSSPNVQQLQMLAKIFADVIAQFSPESILVPGSTTGNGFDCLSGGNIKRIVGVDINPEYIDVCRSRYGKKLPGLELICSDLSEIDFPENSFDLIHAALIFEYVEAAMIMKKFARWLRTDGKLSVILQLPGKGSSPVSESPFQSVKILSDVINLIEPGKLKESAAEMNLKCINEELITLSTGKQFQKMIFKK
ncbi:MAG: class I SAM-dependent methyltransferase [Melioribacteraceae bacterium]